MGNEKYNFDDLMDNLASEKRNINQLFLASRYTIAELRKIDFFVEQLKTIISKINDLLKEHELLKKSKNFNIENKEYTELINKILVEYRFLLATDKAMNNNLNEINRTEGIQTKISGKMIQLQKDTDKVLRKINKLPVLDTRRTTPPFG